MAYDLTAIKMNIDLGDSKQVVDKYNALIKTLETKHVTLNIDVSKLQASVALASEEVQKAYKKMEEEANKTKQAMKFDYKNSIIDNSSIDKFRQSLAKVRSDIKEISNVKVTYGKNESGNGLGKIDSAVVTYTNNMNKLVTETLAWAETTDRATGEQVRRWQTVSVTVNDNRKAIEQLNQATDKASSNMKNKLQNITTGKSWVKDLQEFKSLQTMIDAFDPTSLKILKQDAIDIADGFKKLQNAIKGVNVGDNISKEFDKASKSLEKFKSSMSGKIGKIEIGKDASWATQLSQYDTLKTKMLELQNFKLNTTNIEQYKVLVGDVAKAYAQTTTEITRVKNEQQQLSQTNAIDDKVINKVRSFNTELEILKNKYSNIQTNPLFQQIQSDVTKLNNTPPTQFNNSVNEITNNIKRLRAEMNTTAKTGNSIFTSLGNSIKSAFSFMTGSMLIYSFAMEIRQLPKLVQDVDKSLVELNKVANLSESAIESFTKQAYEMGDALGRTGKEVTDATTEMIKAGYEMNEAATLAKSAMLSMNVGSGMNDLELATNSLIATIKGFEFEAEKSNEVVDKMAKVSDITAIGYSELADGIQRVSAVMNQGKTSFEQTLGLLTSTFELSRNIEKSSAGINTISQRMRGLKLSENGELEKDVELLSKVENKLKTIANVELMDEKTGQLRSTFDVLQDLSKVWETLNINEQQFLTETLAGNRQNVILAQILQNWEAVDKAVLATSESTGYAQEVNERYLDSVGGRIASLKSSWEQLAINSLSSDFLKDVLSATNGVVQFIDACGGLQQILLGVVTSFVAFKVASLFLSEGGMVVGIKDAIKSLLTLKFTTDATTGSTLALSAAQKTLGAGLIIAGIMAAGYAINYISESTERAEKKVAELGEELSGLNSNSKTVEDLAKQYDELNKLSKAQGLNNEEQQKFYDIQNQLKEIMPTISGYYNEMGNFIISNKENMESLIATQKESIELKRQEHAEASKKTFSEHKIDYNREKKALKELIELKQLKDKSKEGSLGYGDKKRHDQLVRMYYMEMKDLDKAIRDVKASSEETFSKTKQDILNVVYATEDWKHATESQKESIQNYISNLSNIEDVEKYFSNIEVAAESLTSSFISLANASEGGIAEYMQALTVASSKTGIPLAELKAIFDDYSISVDDASETTDEFSVSIDDIKESIENFSSDINMIDSAMEKLKSGSGLTSDEILKLTNKFPQLRSELVKTEDGYTINEKALASLRGETIDYEKQSIQSQINATKQAIVSSMDRISTYRTEILAINSLSDAMSALDKAGKGAKGDSLFGSNYRPSTYVDELTGEEQKIYDQIKTIEGLYQQLENIDVVATGGVGNNTTKDSKSKSNAEKQIKDVFDAKIKAILSMSSELERAIQLTQNQLEIAELKGEEEKATKLKQQLINQQKDRRDILHKQANELRKLLSQTNDVEIKAGINDEIIKLQDDFHASKVQQYEDEIALIQRRNELEKQGYDDKLKQLELQQFLMSEDSAEYKAIEEEKIAMLLQLQQGYQEKIKQLNALGLSNNHEYVREYINLYADAQMEILNLHKARMDKERQAEINSLNKQREAMQEIYDSKKKIYDLAFEMLKEEEKARLDAEKNVVKEQIDGMKKVADERKRQLQKEKDERYFNKDVDKRNEEINSIQNELNKLQFDNSEWAIAERLRLEKELKEKTEELDDKFYDDKIDEQLDAIDEQVRLFEEQKNAELELIERNAKTDAELRQKANEIVDKDNKALYKKLQDYVLATNKMTKYEFETTWATANKGLEEFGIKGKSTLDVLYEMADVMKKLADESKRLTDTPIDYGKPPTSSGGSGGASTPNTGLSEKGKQQLNQQKYLHQQMVMAKETNNKALEDWVKKQRKAWGLDPDTGAIVKQFHKGLDYGQVGTGLKPDELVAKLVKKEWVFTDNQFGNLTNNIKGLVSQRQSAIPPINLNFYGTVTSDAKPLLDSFKKDVIKDIYKIVNQSI